VAERELPKLEVRVRFPSPAPIRILVDPYAFRFDSVISQSLDRPISVVAFVVPMIPAFGSTDPRQPRQVS
jgi:hypothetical protein